jgi:hypothetical protein
LIAYQRDLWPWSTFRETHFTFTSTVEAHPGDRAAIALVATIVETCSRLKIPIRDYLGSILPGLADLPVSRIAKLTPTAWAARS